MSSSSSSITSSSSSSIVEHKTVGKAGQVLVWSDKAGTYVWQYKWIKIISITKG